MPKSVLGINMGNYSIKVVELTRRGNAFVVANLLEAPTKEAIVSGDMIQPDVVAATLKEMIQAAKIKTKDAVISVGGQTGVVVRITELPKMPRKELLKAIPLEIDRHLPFQSGGIVRDYVLLKEPEEVKEGEQIPVLFAAARADLVDAYLLAVQQAGLSPIAVEVEPLAAARALYAAQGWGMEDGRPGRVTVLVNIGHEGTEISFVEGGTLVFTRLVPIGGQHLTESIRDHLGMDLEEAERLKKEQATAWIERPEPSAPPPSVAAPPAPTPTQPVAPPPSEEAPSLSLELPTQQQPAEPSLSFELPTEPQPQPQEAPTLSFDLPTEPPAPKEEAKEQGFSLEFSLPLPGEEPQPAPSLEFTPGQPTREIGLQAPPTPPIAEEWVPSQPVISEALPIHELLFNAISPRLVELAGEIARSVEFLMSQRPNIEVREVYLLGGGALLKDIDKFLQAQLGVPVVFLNAFRYMDISPVAARLGQDHVKRVAPSYAIAAGLALWAYF